MKRIVWLASYPKSGNTWCRVFLTNLMRDEEQAAEINRLDTYGIASSRALFDDVTGVGSSDLTAEEIARLRPGVVEFLAEHATASPLFVKIHDAYGTTPAGAPLIPESATQGVVYLVRNPLDVVVSYAYHSDSTIDRVIGFMGNERARIAGHGDGLTDQLEQRLSSWSRHVLSWMESPLPVHLARYEDLLAGPLAGFTAIATHLGLPDDRRRVQKAIEFSAFDRLRQQEDEDGFRERAATEVPFFRQGKAGGWRTALAAEQVERIVADHGDVMQRLGYLDEAGEPAITTLNQGSAIDHRVT